MILIAKHFVFVFFALSLVLTINLKQNVVKAQTTGHTCTIEQGRLFCQGDNTYGQLGNGEDGFPIEQPTLVKGLPYPVTAFATGRYHTCAIAAGELYCWGRNTFGQIGRPAPSFSSIPLPVQGFKGNVMSLALGDDFSCASQQRSVWCWGNNMLGSIGDGSVSHHYRPHRVMTTTASSAVLLAWRGSVCALMTPRLFCWGEITQSRTPLLVSGSVSGAKLANGVLSVSGQDRCVYRFDSASRDLRRVSCVSR